MASVIDITGKITNELPMVRITDDLTVTVNNRKNTILNIQAMVEEKGRVAKEKQEEVTELDLMDKALQMLIGEKNTNAINEMDLPFPEYKYVYTVIMAAATGKSVEDLEKEQRFQ